MDMLFLIEDQADYYLLCGVLPEDRVLREQLQQKRLVSDYDRLFVKLKSDFGRCSILVTCSTPGGRVGESHPSLHPARCAECTCPELSTDLPVFEPRLTVERSIVVLGTGFR